MTAKRKTRKGRNPFTGETVELPVVANRPAKKSRKKVAKKAVKAKRRKHTVKAKRRATEPRDLIALRISVLEREGLEQKARELNLSFSEVIREGLREHYSLPEPEFRKEKVIS